MTAAGWILMVLWTVVIVALIAGVVYWLARSASDRPPEPAGSEPSARQILDRRLASGEIGIDEHTALKAAIGEEEAPPSSPPVPPGRPAAASG